MVRQKLLHQLEVSKMLGGVSEIMNQPRRARPSNLVRRAKPFSGEGGGVDRRGQLVEALVGSKQEGLQLVERLDRIRKLGRSIPARITSRRDRPDLGLRAESVRDENRDRIDRGRWNVVELFGGEPFYFRAKDLVNVLEALGERGDNRVHGISLIVGPE
jgi:hypothetical protein